MSDYDYTVAAHHESGHVVGAYLLGMPIRSVYITPMLSQYVPGLTIGEAVERGLVRACAIVAALGRVVEEKLFGRYDAECCDVDREVIEEGLLPRITDEQEREKLRKELSQLAEELVARPGFVHAVRVLAQELLKRPGTRKEIGGAEAVAIIQAALKSQGSVR
ncbi:MAG TPA: hypothetical protein VKU02_03945 [Gemmataceae bacterium]|nr:hypothetical protein [Gemmataceae bacterium]